MPRNQFGRDNMIKRHNKCERRFPYNLYETILLRVWDMVDRVLDIVLDIKRIR